MIGIFFGLEISRKLLQGQLGIGIEFNVLFIFYSIECCCHLLVEFRIMSWARRGVSVGELRRG